MHFERQHFLPRAVCALIAITCLAFAPSHLLAQGQTFDNCADWEAATCGNIVEAGYLEALQAELPDISFDSDFFGVLVDQGLQLNHGTFTQFGYSGINGLHLPSINFTGAVVEPVSYDAAGERRNWSYFDVDPALGSVEGLCFSHAIGNVVVEIWDGDNLIETFSTSSVVPDGNDTLDTIEFSEFGWLNVDGVNVTRIGMNAVEFFPEATDIAFITAPTISFGEYCPPFTTPEIVGGAVIEEIDTLIDTGVLTEGEGNPSINFITQALRDIGKGKIGKALAKLEAAIERLQGLIDDGTLDAGEGEGLIAMLQLIIDNI